MNLESDTGNIIVTAIVQLQRKRGPLDPQIGQLILGVVSGAASEIDVAAANQ